MYRRSSPGKPRGPGHGTRGDPAAPIHGTEGHETARAPSTVEILRAVPTCSVRLRGTTIERRYLDAIGADPRYLELRPIAAINTLRIAKRLARGASYRDGTTRRGRQSWWQLAGLSWSTWKAVRRRLEAWGYLGCVEEGTTPEFSPMALFRGKVNRAAVYVLCIPRPERRTAGSYSPVTGTASPQVRPQTRPPTQSGRTVVESPARAREANPGNTRHPSRAGSAGAQSLRPVAELLRKAAGQPISDGWCGWLARPFAAAGWTLADLRWAIDHTPDGAQHRYSAKVRHGVGWLRHRLGLWLEADGRARSSIRVMRQESRDRIRAEVDKHRAAMAEASASWTDPAPYAARIRAQFRWGKR